jgi:hypothetical protein
LGNLVIPVTTALTSTYSVDATAALPTRYEGIAVRITNLSMVLNGTADQGTPSAADDKPFITNPSVCGTPIVKGDLTSKTAQAASSSPTITISGCPAGFSSNPTFTAVPTSLLAAKPTGFTIGVTNPAPTVNPTVKRIKLAFPVGVELNPAVGNNGNVATGTCATATIDTNDTLCPAGSLQGTVSMTTPLLAGSFTGNVYLESPGTTAATRYKLAIVIALPGRKMILHGSASVAGSTDVTAATGVGSTSDTGSAADNGQIVADFNNIPDLAFSTMTINLVNAGNANRNLFVQPNVCSAINVAGTFSPNSSSSAANDTTANSANWTPTSCGGAFTPTFTASISSNTQSGHPNLTLGVTGNDTDTQLTGLTVHLPVGLVAATTATATCSQASAALATCAKGRHGHRIDRHRRDLCAQRRIDLQRRAERQRARATGRRDPGRRWSVRSRKPDSARRDQPHIDLQR